MYYLGIHESVLLMHETHGNPQRLGHVLPSVGFGEIGMAPFAQGTIVPPCMCGEPVGGEPIGLS